MMKSYLTKQVIWQPGSEGYVVSCLFCRKRVWYRRNMSNPFARNSEKTYTYECPNCKIIIIVKNESDRKSRGTRGYWQDKTIVQGKVMKVLVRNA